MNILPACKNCCNYIPKTVTKSTDSTLHDEKCSKGLKLGSQKLAYIKLTCDEYIEK